MTCTALPARPAGGGLPKRIFETAIMNRQHNSEMAHPAPMALQLALAELEARALMRVALMALGLLGLRLVKAPARWHRRARQRAALAELDDRLLRDIGIDRVARHAECRKWFWMG